jgi:predicted aspartyl protease
VIEGSVTAEGVPEITLMIGGRPWIAVVDTGFNGDLELPLALREFVNPRYLCRIRSQLAGGKTIEEDCFLIDFIFDGEQIEAEATFVNETNLLIGTHLLQQHRLTIDFVRQTLSLKSLKRPRRGK